MSFVPNPRWIELFPQQYIPIIIQDVLDTAPQLEPPPTEEKRPEEFLSRQVCQRLRRNKRYYTGPLTPNIEHWLTNLGSRADIVFHCGKGQETYFVVEAKRLFVVFPGGRKASLVREYVDQGIMRFIDNRYAPYQQAAAMLAYVFNVSCRESASRNWNGSRQATGKGLFAGKFRSQRPAGFTACRRDPPPRRGKVIHALPPVC